MDRSTSRDKIKLALHKESSGLIKAVHFVARKMAWRFSKQCFQILGENFPGGKCQDTESTKVATCQPNADGSQLLATKQWQ